MKLRVLLFAFLVLALGACAQSGPAPTGPLATPSPVVTLAPAASQHPEWGVTPMPLGEALEPGAWPTVQAQVALGVKFEQPLQHALALDPASAGGRGQIFVGVPPAKTLVLSADTLRVARTLEWGGDLAVSQSQGQLYIGAPGGVVALDLDSFALQGTVPVRGSRFGSTPVVDESTGALYVVRNGVHVVSPGSFETTSLISGTSPAGNSPGPIAVDAAFDALHRRLYISLNNGIPGSNNGNGLMVYDVRSQSAVYQDGERSVVGLAADEAGDRLVFTRSRMSQHSFSMLEAGIRPGLRINGITCSVKVDPERGRIYIADSSTSSPRLLVLDSKTGALLADVPLPRQYTLAAFDAGADLLYFLSPDGYLLVMSGHGGAPSAPPSEPLAATNVLTGSVAWIAAAPVLPAASGVASPTLFAAWTLGRQPAGGPLGAPAGQLMVSPDGGSTWARVRGGLPQHLLVNALAFSPDFARDGTLFASLLSSDGHGGGIYISTDGGSSWRPATRGLTDWVVADMAVAPGLSLDPAVFVLTWQTGLFRVSSDSLSEWRRTGYRAGSPAAMNVRAMSVSPDYTSDHTLVVGSGDASQISRDGGETWWSLVGSRALSLFYRSSQSLVGSFADMGVARSEDGGTSWQAISSGLRFEVGSRVTVIPAPGPVMFALVQSLGGASLYRTTDGGANWQVETSGWAGKARLTALALSPRFGQDAMLYAGLEDGRVQPLNANELRWSAAPANLDRLNVEAVSVSPAFASDRTVFMGSAQTGLFVSTSGGTNWREVGFPARSLGLDTLHLALSPAFGQDHTLFAAAGGQVFRSRDGGARWQPLSGLGNLFPVSALALSPGFERDGTLLLGGDDRAPRLVRSVDGGETWMPTRGIDQHTGISAIAFAPGDSRIVLAWAEGAGLYRSGDGGLTWTRVFSAPEGGGWTLQSLAISPDFARDRIVYAGFVGARNLQRSADGGATWHPSDTGLPPDLTWGSAIAIAPGASDPRDRLMLLGADRGVFRSTNGGVNWKLSSTGLAQGDAGRLAGVLSFALSPDWAADHTLFAGLVNRGLYISQDGGLTWKPAK